MNIDKMVEACIKYNISLNQFALVYMLNNNSHDLLNKYVAKVKFNPDELYDLEEKEIITIMKTDGGKINTRNIIINPSFIASVFCDVTNAAEEFSNAFYDLVEVNGGYLPARNISPEDLEVIYAKVHNGDLEKHQKLIEALLKYKSKLSMVGKQYVGKFAMRKFFDSKFHDIIIDDNFSGGNEDSYISL